ncbi:MAG: histidinol-phosphate transaminase [Candidatus Marinimicrobia bacterium]|nr:histidinol-phosphate transaminase [Candidatus Neomarinimicrobiota bacterium]
MPLVPRNIKALDPYKAGKPIEEVKRELGLKKVIKLASNENPQGPPESAITAARLALQNVHRYPDPSGYTLRMKLAERFNVKLENVIHGAGSEGIMSTIMRTFLLDDDEIITATGSFIGFRVLAEASGNPVHWVPMKDYRYDLAAMAKLINDYTKIIYIANPDNPTGSYVTKAEFDEFMTHVPDRVLVILDEAYFEYAQATPDYPDSMHYRYDNVITLRTFSKVYGMAGLRVGYGFAHDELIGNLLKVKLPFEMSIPAQAAAEAALEDEEYLKQSLEINRTGLGLFEKTLREWGIRYIPSVTNFITLLFDTPEQATDFAQKMLLKGVIVRPLGGFRQPNCVRITVGLPEENAFCLGVMEKVLERQ